MKKAHETLTTPTDDDLKKISTLLFNLHKNNTRQKQYASVKVVLTVIGMGATIGAAFIAPKAAGVMGKALLKNIQGFDDWKKLNAGYLRQTLKRLEKQKLVEYTSRDGKEVITITNQGRKKILSYALRELTLAKPLRWDGKWHLVIYDIPKEQKQIEEILRKTLKRMGMFPLQESVYLTPYPCFAEIEFLRRYYGLASHIKYVLATKLEDDTAYKTYFGL